MVLLSSAQFILRPNNNGLLYWSDFFTDFLKTAFIVERAYGVCFLEPSV